MGAGHFVIYAAAHAFEVVALLEHRGAPAAKVLRFGHQSLTPLKLSRTCPPFPSRRGHQRGEVLMTGVQYFGILTSIYIVQSLPERFRLLWAIVLCIAQTVCLVLEI